MEPFYLHDQKDKKPWINYEYLIQLNITSNCPRNCEFCYIKAACGDKKELSLSQIKELWKNLSDVNKKLGVRYRINLTGGDIFAHPEWRQIAEFLRDEKSVFAVDPLINRFWTEDQKDLLIILGEKTKYIQMNLEVVTEEDIKFAQDLGKRIVLKISLYDGLCKKDVERLKYFVDKFENVIASIDIIIPQKNNCLEAKKYILNNYQELKRRVEELQNIFGKRLWLLSSVIKRELKGEIYFCPVPFGGTYIMPDGSVVPCSRYPHLETGFTIENFDLEEYVKKFNKLTSNSCLYENKFFKEYWDEKENPTEFIKENEK